MFISGIDDRCRLLKFTHGLHPSIAADVSTQDPKFLREAMKLAELYELKYRSKEKGVGIRQLDIKSSSKVNSLVVPKQESPSTTVNSLPRYPAFYGNPMGHSKFSKTND